MKDTASKLQSLKLGRQARSETAAGFRWWIIGLAGLFLGVLIAVPVTLWLVPKPEPVIILEDGEAGDAALSQGASIKSGVVASGYVVARNQATVASEITGLVKKVLVEEGQQVRKGEVLAQLDDRLARANYQALLAQAQALVANLKDAEQSLIRTRSLTQSGYASSAALISAKARYESQRSTLEQFRKQADYAKVQLSKYIIRAPFTGIVVSKNAQSGEIISPVSAGGGFTRTGICTLVDMDSLEIEVDVSEVYISEIKADQKVEAVLDAYQDDPFDAKVIAVVPSANRSKATVRVRVGILDKDPRILPEMAVKVVFQRETGV